MGARHEDPNQWRNRPLASYLDAAARDPDRLGLVAYRGDQRTALTYRQYDEEADRVARGISDLGIRSGDAVAVQLPNWWQFGPLEVSAALPYTSSGKVQKFKLREQLIGAMKEERGPA